MTPTLEDLRQYATEHPWIGDQDTYQAPTIPLDHGQWTVGLSLNR